MSFSNYVKEDILKVNTDNESRLLELESLLRFGGEIVLGRPLKLVFSCSNLHTLRYFMSLIKHYKNVILFHGHSHTKLQLQELDANANCSDSYGYRSIHIPCIVHIP